MKKYSVAVFDFDGTITTKDSFLDFIAYNFGFFGLVFGIIRILPTALLYRAGKIHNSVPKRKLLTMYFKGMTKAEFDKRCKDYSLNRIDQILRDSLMERVKWHKEQGHKIVIASASIDSWIKPWADKNGFDKVIATKIGVTGGLITGDFGSTNCYGEQKARSFLEQYPERQDYYLYVYGGSKSDSELLESADERVTISKFLS